MVNVPTDHSASQFSNHLLKYGPRHGEDLKKDVVPALTFLSPEVHAQLKCTTVCDKYVSETQVRVYESTEPEEDTHPGRGFKKASWRRWQYRMRRVSINQVGRRED